MKSTISMFLPHLSYTKRMFSHYSYLTLFFFYSKGGVILVSHDERLIRKICKELWVVSGGIVTSLDGGIDEYKKLVQAELESN